MNTQQHQHTDTPAQPNATPMGSLIQVLRDHSIIDATVRELLDTYNVHPSDIRLFAFGECARYLRFRPALAGVVTEIASDRLRSAISGGALDEKQVDWIMANLLDGSAILVVKVYSLQARRQVGSYLIKRRQDELIKQQAVEQHSELGDEQSQPRSRVSATEKAADRRADHSSRYARASRTEGVGHWGTAYR